MMFVSDILLLPPALLPPSGMPYMQPLGGHAGELYKAWDLQKQILRGDAGQCHKSKKQHVPPTNARRPRG